MVMPMMSVTGTPMVSVYTPQHNRATVHENFVHMYSTTVDILYNRTVLKCCTCITVLHKETGLCGTPVCTRTFRTGQGCVGLLYVLGPTGHNRAARKAFVYCVYLFHSLQLSWFLSWMRYSLRTATSAITSKS